MVDDPLVRLVRDVDVDVVNGLPALRQHLLRRADHDTRRELEHLAAVHLHELVRVLEVARAAARQPEVLAAAAVGAQLEAEKAALLDPLDHDRARSVAEQNERGAVGPVEDLGQDVTADHERPLREARRDHPVCLGERVHEPRAAGEQVVGRRIGHSERVREQRRAGREHHVRRHRRNDDQVDRGCVDACVCKRRKRGRRGDVGERLLLGREPALADPGPLDDPLVRRVDELLEILVGEHALRDVDPQAGDPDRRTVSRPDHECSVPKVRCHSGEWSDVSWRCTVPARVLVARVRVLGAVRRG